MDSSSRSCLPVSSQERHTDIIAKLEKATGPDRELDALIYAALGNWSRYGWGEVVPVVTPGRAGVNIQVGSVSYTEEVPALTASLDASLALVEEHLPIWDYCLSKGFDEPACASLAPFDQVEGSEADAPTMPIAVLTALFKALTSDGSASIASPQGNSGRP